MCCKRLNLIINKIVFTIIWFLAFGYLKKELVQSLIYTRHGRFNKGNRRAHIRHLCRKTAVLSCHRCLIDTGVEKMYYI